MNVITQMFLGWFIGIIIVAPTSYYFLRRQLRKHNRLLAENEARLKAEHEEWLSKRRSGMTKEQREAEYRYCIGLRNMPVEDRLKTRDRPDMPFLGFYQEHIKESIFSDSNHSGIGVNRKLNK